MQEHFVTVFDRGFLPQGVALHSSMKRHIDDFCLWVLCIDDETADFIDRLGWKSFKTILLTDVLTEELSRLQEARSRAEFCWTLTPFLPNFVFAIDKRINRVTYLDADLWFMQSPRSIFSQFEASGGDVMITKHNYSPEYDQSERSGTYCVQFITFCRHRSEDIRKLWERQCVAWCFARFEDGKFGDQKYLDTWPKRFGSRVFVLPKASLCQAPWNAAQHSPKQAVFYHFHAFRIINKGDFLTGAYFLPKETIAYIYRPYISDFFVASKMMDEMGLSLVPQAKTLALYKKVLYQVREFIRSRSFRKLTIELNE